MKILFLSHAFEKAGAYARQREMARAFVAEGWDVYWLAPGWRKPIPGVTLLPMIGIKEGDKREDLGTMEFFFRVLRSFRVYRRVLEDIDLVIVTREYDALAVCYCKYLNATPVILFSRGDTISNFEVRLQLGAERKDRISVWLNRIKIIWHKAVVQKFVYPRMAAIVVQTEPLRGLLLSRHGIQLAKKIYVLPNNCNWRKIIKNKPRKGFKNIFMANYPRVGFFFGSGWDIKGGDIFLKAIAIARKEIDFQVIICGHAREGENQIKRLQCQIGNRWLCYLGFVHNLPFYFRIIDLLVVPSRWDNCPNVVLEAMEAGCCVIASDIHCHRYILNYDDLLFPPQNPIALANKIKDILTDSNYRRKLQLLILKRRELFRFDWGKECVKIGENIIKSI